MKHNLFSRFLGVLLAVVMLASLMSMPSLADTVAGTDTTAISEEQTAGEGDTTGAGSTPATQSETGEEEGQEESADVNTDSELADGTQEPAEGTGDVTDPEDNTDTTQEPTEGTEEPQEPADTTDTEGTGDSETNDQDAASQTVDGQALLDELMAKSDEDLLPAVQSLSDEQVASLEALGDDALSGLLNRLESITSSPVEEPEEPVAVMDYNSMSAEDLYNYLCGLTDDATYVQVMDSLSEEKKAELWDYLDSISTGESETVTEDNGIVNFLNAAPLVTAAPVAAGPMKMRAMAKQGGVSTAFDTNNVTAPAGLEISKKLDYDSEKDEYTLTLEAYVTGNVQTGESKPVDVILVLDQSGSMAEDINVAYRYDEQTGYGNDAAFNNQNNLYVHGDDGKYYPVKISRTNGEVITRYNLVNDRTRVSELQDGWFTPDYYYSSDGKSYVKIEVDQGDWIQTGHNFWDGYYEYVIVADGNEIYRGQDKQLSQAGLDNHIYTQSTETIYDYTYSWDSAVTVNSQPSAVSTGAYAQPPVNLYTRVATETKSKKEALSDAVTSFVNSLKASNANSRVAIVGFGSQSDEGKNTEIMTLEGYNSSSDQGWVGVAYDTVTRNNESENNYYSKALVNVGNPIVEKAINALATQGATRTDLGMELAKGILDHDDSDNQKVVIMFTDGEPTTSRDFSNMVANSTIKYAYQIKSEATVYTVGIFNGADGTNPGNANDLSNSGDDRNNKFMHAVSSNYPNATGDQRNNAWYNHLGDLNASISDTEDQAYYLSADSAEALNEAFTNISEEVGSASVDLDDTTVLYDEMSPYFDVDIDEAAGRDIKVYTANATAIRDNGDVTWANKIDVTEQLNPTEIIENDRICGIQVDGFDYKDQYVAKVNNKVQGAKLILEIPVKYNGESFGGNNIPTNEGTSGIYNADGSTCYGNFEIPKVNVKVDYEIAAKDQTIYLTNSADLTKLLGYADKTEGDAFYTPDGVKNAFVDITYTMKDATGKPVAVLKVANGTSISSSQWKQVDAYGNATETDLDPIALEDCTYYTIECMVSPITQGDSSLPGEVATEKRCESKIGNVHVLTPKIKTKDAQVEAGTTWDTDTLSQQYGTVIWTDQNDLITEENATSDVAVKPVLTITAQSIHGDDPSNSSYTFTQDTYFQLVVKIDTRVLNKAEGEYQVENIPISHNANEHDCIYDEAYSDNTHDFIIHVYTDYGTLKITKKLVQNGKSVTGKNDVFVFKLVDKNDKAYYYMIYLEGKSEGAITCTLPTGEYEITELNNSDYNKVGCTAQNGEVEITGNHETEVTFENSPKDNNIPTDNSGVVNTYDYIGDGGVVIWKEATEMGKDNHDNITSSQTAG